MLTRFLIVSSLCLVVIPTTVAIVEIYTLNVSSTAPAIYGSKVIFQAQLLMNTGSPPKDVKRFKYEWRRTGSTFVETTYANFNSTLHSCYSVEVQPGKYKMKVTVFDTESNKHTDVVARKEIDFRMTENLNGLVQVKQNHEHVGHLTKNNTFSTHKEVHLFVNITDIFPEKPSLLYYWFINDEAIVGQNTPQLSRNITGAGKHKVVAIATVNKIGFQDCAGFYYGQILNGSFSTEINMKDPVGNYVVFGKHSTELGTPISLTIIWQTGTGPFNFTWTLESADGTKILNKSSHVIELSNANITLDSNVLSELGDYRLNMSIENAVSLLNRTLQLSVKQPTPAARHSASTVVFSAIGGLAGMTLFLLIFLKVKSYRDRTHHIETADFDFHPFLTSSNDQPVSSSPLTVIKAFLGRLRPGSSGTGSTGTTARRNMVSVCSSEATTSKTSYGSITESLEDALPRNA